MEFQQNKKSRLDLEALQQQQDNMRSSTPAGSSGRLSTGSGGGGGGGGGPFRGQYTRSSLGAMSSSTMSSSRFSPYSLSRERPSPRRTIPVIRARRDDDASSTSSRDSYGSSNFGSTSSTAQRIMETLAAMSTPVLDAGRVRIDSIKSMKPTNLGSSLMNSTGSFLSSSSKFNGPPKTSTPLLLPKSATGVRPDFNSSNWSLKCLSIPPKTIDCGTNTDDYLMLNNDKNGNASSTSSSPLNANSNVNKNPPYHHLQMQLTNSADSKKTSDDKLMSSRPAVAALNNGRFVFEEPWSLDQIDECIEKGKLQGTNVLEQTSSASSTSSSDENDDDDDNENDTDDVDMTDKKVDKIPNGDVNDFKYNNTKKPIQITPVPATSPLKMFSTSSVKVSDQWECPTCMVQNKSSDNSCVCCTTANPKPVAKLSTDKTDSSTKMPSLAKYSPFVNLKHKKNKINMEWWSCPTCMVPNEPTAASCVCCSEANPNPVVSDDNTKSAVTEAPAATFKFGISASAAAATSSAAATGSGFKFGAPSSTSSKSSDNSNASFSFGFKTPSSAASTTAAPVTTTTTSSVVSPLSTSTSSTITPFSSSNASTSFSFGAKTADPIKTSTTSATPTPANTFKFGMGPPPSESPNKKIELWQCDVCPEKNKFELLNCATCSSPRPRELDPNYKKPEEKPKSDLKFEPVFGGMKSSSSSFAGTAPSIFTSNSNNSTFGSSASSGFGSVATAGSTFGGSAATGNPFGGAPAFGSFGGNTGAVFGSALEKSAQPPTVTTTASSSSTTTSNQLSSATFGSNASNTTNTGPFMFGSPAGGMTATTSPKRKHDDAPEDNASAKKVAMPAFAFGASAPTLKLKEPVPAAATPQPSNPAAAGPVNNAGFLEALKNASAAVKASTENKPFTIPSSTPEPAKQFSFGNSSFNAPSPGFPAPTNPNASFTFGNNPSSGFRQTPALSTPQQAVAPPSASPAPPQFNMTPNFSFGAAAATAAAPSFTFGANANPSGPGGGFNFGAGPAPTGGATNNPALFQFQANPSAQGERKIKKATRRFQRN